MRVFRNIDDFKPRQKTIVTIGTFDGVHAGHQKIIRRLQELKQETGGETTILTFDPHPRKVLLPAQTDLKLITTTDEKCALLGHFGVDNVIIYPFTVDFSKLHANEYIGQIIARGLHTGRLVIGYDHRFGSNREGNIDTLKQVAGQFSFTVEEIPAQDIDHINVSSTRIRKAIEEGDMNTANRFLGYPFFVTGEVVKGKQLGRTIGYPTANIHIADPDKIVPKIGVYAVRVWLNGRNYKGMLNVGVNPTTDTDNKLKVEVNIFDFSEDIYGQVLKVEFIRRTRNEEKFDSLDELKQKLHEDGIECRAILKDL